MDTDKMTILVRALTHTRYTFSTLQGFVVFLVAGLLTSCSGAHLAERDERSIATLEQFKTPDNWLTEMGKLDPFDPRGGLLREDYEALFFTDSFEKTPGNRAGRSPDLPDVSDLLMDPGPAQVANDKLVTLSVTEDVPVKEVMIELARRADVDIEMDPGIEGGIIFRAKDRPFSEVIERVAKLAGLRYKIEDGVLRVERDLPYILNYRMNMLDMVRSSSSSITIDTDLIGQSGGSEGGDSGFTSGSTSSVDSASGAGDIWAVIEEGVANILAGQNASVSDASSGSSSREGSDAIPSAVISVNRQVGVVTVQATQREHDMVKAYLDHVQMSYTAQVLIEAKILEVVLNDRYRSGIDWSFINDNVTEFSARSRFDTLSFENSLSNDTFTLGVLPSELFGLEGTSLEASIELVESFGVTRTLSSPRLHAMNNQHAVLTFAENFVYFELTVEEETSEDTGGDTTTITIDSEPRVVPVGVILNIQPSIDTHREEITMNVRPTLSRIVRQVEDPGVSLLAAQFNSSVQSQIPVIEVRELDSVLRLRSGEIMVIGGLMEERVENTDRGVPGVAKVPLLGNAFKSVHKDADMVETVIFIKATIVPGSGVSVEDKEFYRKFTTDAHKWKL